MWRSTFLKTCARVAGTPKVSFLAERTNHLNTSIATGQELAETLLLLILVWTKDSGLIVPWSWANDKFCAEFPPGHPVELTWSGEWDDAPDSLGNFLEELPAWTALSSPLPFSNEDAGSRGENAWDFASLTPQYVENRTQWWKQTWHWRAFSCPMSPVLPGTSTVTTKCTALQFHSASRRGLLFVSCILSREKMCFQCSMLASSGKYLIPLPAKKTFGKMQGYFPAALASKACDFYTVEQFKRDRIFFPSQKLGGIDIISLLPLEASRKWSVQSARSWAEATWVPSQPLSDSLVKCHVHLLGDFLAFPA